MGSYFSFSSLQLSGFYAIDETKILLVKGSIIFGLLGMLKTGIVVYFRLSEVRSSLDVLIMFNGVKGLKIKILGKELDDYFYTMVYQLIISYQGLVLSMIM